MSLLRKGIALQGVLIKPGDRLDADSSKDNPFVTTLHTQRRG